MARANLARRSNVMLSGDSRFLREVRGRSALLRLLQRMFPATNLGDPLDVERAVRRARLTDAQRVQLTDDIPCALCGCRPVGPVRCGGDTKVEFRCPTGECLW
jgi:hypothetical protein